MELLDRFRQDELARTNQAKPSVRYARGLAEGEAGGPMTEQVDPACSAQMSLVRGRDTKPEMRVGHALHIAGLRYRLHAKDFPGRPGVVFRIRRLVVFIHGCFWHQDPNKHCRLARMPKSRLDFRGTNSQPIASMMSATRRTGAPGMDLFSRFGNVKSTPSVLHDSCKLSSTRK